MKKIMAVMLSLLACTVLLAGCNTSSESNEEQSLKVYSFSGENEYISVSNGVIILDGKDEICYGGDLKVMSDDFANITTYSTTIYINGSEKETLLSNGVDDQTGETILNNLLQNILTHSDASKVFLTVTETEQQAKIVVADNGNGIAASDLPHIFERMYQCDHSRSAKGNGLGLSIAKELVSIHKGTITAASVPGNGTTFIIILPKAL